MGELYLTHSRKLSVVLVVIITTTTLFPGPAVGMIQSGSQTTVTEIEGCKTITEPGYYELTQDIINSSAKECILIRSNDVVFDGNGHVIDGVGQNVTGHKIPIRVGYSNQYHIQNVTVKNVIVKEWFQGVGISRASNNTIRNVTARYNNQYGIYLGDNATHNTVADSTATDTIENGIFLADYSDHNRIVNNTVRRNGNGISIYDSDHNIVANNTAINNAKKGIFLGSNASYNRISNNSVTENPNGIRAVSDSSRNIIEHNYAVNNSKKGIVVARGAHRNKIDDNNASFNGRLGIQLHNSDRNILANNTVIGNVKQGFLLVNASGNTFANNTVRSNGKWSIEARDGAENNTIKTLNISDSTVITLVGDTFSVKPRAATELPSNKATLGTPIHLGDLVYEDGILIVFHLSETQLAKIDRSSLQLWQYEGSWSPVGDSQFYPKSNTLEAYFRSDRRAVIPVYSKDTPTPSPTDTRTPTETRSPKPTPGQTQQGTSPSMTQTQEPVPTSTGDESDQPTMTETPGQAGFGFAITLVATIVTGLLARCRKGDL